MFESKDEIKEAVEALMQATAAFERGSIVPWGLIEKHSGPHLDHPGKYIVRKWMRRVEKEREILTLVSLGVGVRFLTHVEAATEIPHLRQRKAYRQVNRGFRQTSLIEVETLSDHQRKLLAFSRRNMASQRLELGRSVRKAAKQVVPTEGNPIRRS